MSTINASAIEQLRGSLSASAAIVTPDSDTYAESLRRWTTTAEKPAAMVVFPTSAEDVSKAVLFSVANKLELAVAGGKHATSGSSSTDGGLCIDLSKMRGVTVDAVKKTATAQGGALWADVDSELAKYGLATVGGTVNHTGIGGLSLGGGYGYLMGQHGMVVDNILEGEFVLADGTIVTASASQNEDLFWAARGAGFKFGVATSLTYQAHDHKIHVYGGILVFPKEKLVEVIHVAYHLIQIGDGRTVTHVAFGAPPPSHQPGILTLVFFDGTDEEAKKFYEPLFSLGPLANMTQMMPYPTANNLLNENLVPGFRRNMKTSATMLPIDPAFASDLFKALADFIQKLPDAALTLIILEYWPFKKIIGVSQTATSFTNRGAYGNILLLSGWTDSKNDDECRSWARTLNEKVRAEYMQRKGEVTDEVTQNAIRQYVNYDSPEAGNGSAYGVNAPRLAELKKKYDPGNVFSKGIDLLA